MDRTAGKLVNGSGRIKSFVHPFVHHLSPYFILTSDEQDESALFFQVGFGQFDGGMENRSATHSSTTYLLVVQQVRRNVWNLVLVLLVPVTRGL